MCCVTQIEYALSEAKSQVILNKNLYLSSESDFSRNRKITLDKFIDILITMEGNSLPTELLNIFEKTPYSASAFVQTRDKVSYKLFQDLLYEFNKNIEFNKTYKGYKILAVDGSVLSIANDKNDKDTLYHRNQYLDANGLHLNALYDVLNKYFIDIYIQGAAYKDERDSVNHLHIPDNSILIFDRGYEGHQFIYDLNLLNTKYILRMKDIDSNGMLNKLNLKDETFDIDVKYKITSFAKFAKEHDGYRCVQKFNYNKYGQFIDFKYRIVRFKLNNGKYETLLTNLPRTFTVKDLKQLYNKRWGIETSFYALKYIDGILRLHSKKKNSIYQEIYAKTVFYNFISAIIKCLRPKNNYNINIKHATEVCRQRFKHKKISYKRILEYQIKNRPNRHDDRKLIVSKMFVPFESRAS